MGEELKLNIKASISQYTQLDKEIKVLKTELKKRELQKKELTNELIKLMDNTNVDCFEMGNNALVHKKMITRQCLSKKYLKEVLKENLNDDNYVEKLLTIIMENRTTKETDTLVCKEI